MRPTCLLATSLLGASILGGCNTDRTVTPPGRMDAGRETDTDGSTPPPTDGSNPTFDGRAPDPDSGVDPALCGNGILDEGERCDPAIGSGRPGACPDRCDAEACSTATLVGAGCEQRCEPMPSTACVNDDGCCPDTCDAISDTDCLDSVATFGTIIVSAYPDTPLSLASATFTARYESTATCTTTTEGVCQLYECRGGGPTPTVRYRSAGRVTIRGGRGGSVVLDPSSDNSYPPFRADELRWSGGDTVTVSAAGAVVDSFSLEGTFPRPFDPRSPTPVMTPTGLRVSARRSTGIRFTWSASGGGVAYAGFSQVVGDLSRSISCRFDAAAGSGTMPASLLNRFSPTVDGSPTTSLSLTHGASPARVVAGDSLISLFMYGSVGMSALVDLQ